MRKYTWNRLLRRFGAVLRVLLISLVGLPCVARASSYDGPIGNIVQIGSVVFIEFINGHYGINSCNAPLFWVTIDTTTSTGQASLAMALTAKWMGVDVYVEGNAVCTVNAPNDGISEALTVLYLH